MTRVDKIGGRDPPRHRRSRASPLSLRHAPRTVRCAAFFVRSEKSNALVGDGVLQFELCGQLTPSLHTPRIMIYVCSGVWFGCWFCRMPERRLTLLAGSQTRFPGKVVAYMQYLLDKKEGTLRPCFIADGASRPPPRAPAARQEGPYFDICDSVRASCERSVAW